MSQQKIPVGILGATGVVGQRFIQMLETHPWFEVAWLAASDRSAGQTYGDAVRWRLKTPIPERVRKMPVSNASPEGAPRVIFAALDAGIARETGAAVCRRRLRRGQQLQRVSHARECSAGHSRGERRPSRADREAVLAQAVGRLHRHQSQLLGHRTGCGACAAASRSSASSRSSSPRCRRSAARDIRASLRSTFWATSSLTSPRKKRRWKRRRASSSGVER